MALEFRDDCQFLGPALPEPFVRYELENEVRAAKLLPKTTGAAGELLQESWAAYRRRLRDLVGRGGALRVRNLVLEPLPERLGYARLDDGGEVETREGHEDGGSLFVTADGSARLRVWATELDADLDAPGRRGHAYRYSPLRIAQRVLLAGGERAGLLTNGRELRLLLTDPARTDSQVVFSLDPVWRRSQTPPAGYLLLLALASPAGLAALPHLADQARLQQTRVTRELRVQARQAIEGFLQQVLDQPQNRELLAMATDRQALAKALWREGLVVIYRLLFILKLESSDDPARAFSFASTSLWRNSFSPTMALARYAHPTLAGEETGTLLEDGLRTLFRLFTDGLQCTELHVAPLGGALFGPAATPILSRSGLRWGEHAVAHLLDRLLWTPARRGATTRERVHYGALDVEDLGRVYEALLELEPGITSEPMCRLRRAKLEVVVPLAQGEPYRPVTAQEPEADALALAGDDNEQEADDTADEADEAPTRRKATKVEWKGAIPPDRFFLRVGLGRKATGSYYTPDSFVRFLVRETLGPQIAERSPPTDPRPAALLKLKVLDSAMGSGHFLVEACRYLGAALYEACRLCDEYAATAELEAEAATEPAARLAATTRAADWRQRLLALPDPDCALLKYLPSAAPEGGAAGFSQRQAEALCRRLVAVNCLYGVDKNPLAVELAKLALWLEAHAEGLPLTFLDHRLVIGDSLTGPTWFNLLTTPGSREPVENLFRDYLLDAFTKRLHDAIACVVHLEANVGHSLAEITEKVAAKARMDRALMPFRALAAAWSGGVMLGPTMCDDEAYRVLLNTVGQTGDLPPTLLSEGLRRMVAKGLGLHDVPADRDALYHTMTSGEAIPALPYDLTFPEVFHPQGIPYGAHGFDAVLGNPPWDAIQFKSKEFFASFEFKILDAPTKRERTAIEERLVADPLCGVLFEQYKEAFEEQKRVIDLLYEFQKIYIDGDLCGRQLDAFRVFMERNSKLLTKSGRTGVLVPSAFHANEGATGVRRLYLEKMALICCYSFENKRKLFEIHSSFKFAVTVAQNGKITNHFSCGFYLQDEQWLFGDRKGRPSLVYSLDFVKRTGGDYLSFLELRREIDAQVANVCYAIGEPFGKVCARLGIPFGAECHMTNDAWRFTPTTKVLSDEEDPRNHGVANRLLLLGYIILHEGKTFWHYNDQWQEKPKYIVSLSQLSERPQWAESARFYRVAFRMIASSTNERTFVVALLPPLCLFGNSADAEQCAGRRPASYAIALVASCSTFAADWCARQMVSANVNLFIINRVPIMLETIFLPFLAHTALRLTCNHAGYAPLWREQFGAAWREPTAPFTWPVLAGDDERWAMRAAIDAVVAQAYGLTREQYAHVLSTFSHSSYRRAPELCLAAFDKLQAIGLDAFTRAHDPYWDIPLVETLPQPVIDLPLPTAAMSPPADGLFPDDATLAHAPPPHRRRRT